MGLGNEFTADLLYSVGNTGTYTLLTGANAGAPGPGPFGYPTGFTYGSVASWPRLQQRVVAAQDISLAVGVKIPAYTSGTIAFIVEAYNGSSYAASKVLVCGEANRLHT